MNLERIVKETRDITEDSAWENFFKGFKNRGNLLNANPTDIGIQAQLEIDGFPYILKVLPLLEQFKGHPDVIEILISGEDSSLFAVSEVVWEHDEKLQSDEMQYTPVFIRSRCHYNPPEGRFNEDNMPALVNFLGGFIEQPDEYEVASPPTSF